jgi:hypothetical protein
MCGSRSGAIGSVCGVRPRAGDVWRRFWWLVAFALAVYVLYLLLT